MSTVAENNKRIARNTLMLYIRMFLTMVIGLYTSRVVLRVLGIVDCGIYGVVGGIVPMFAFINSSMAASTQRFLTFEIGKGVEGRVKQVFNSAVLIHAIIAFLVFVVAETVGLWFLETQMIIPEERMEAARWVYQFTVLYSVVSIMYVPYNALIIAYERMSVFAYISVTEAVLKLLVLYLVLAFDADRLVTYALLMLVLQLMILLAYFVYSKRNFKDARLELYFNRPLLNEMTSFAGWSLYGNVAFVMFSQGLNILLNVFFGAVVNAARGFAVQVQSAVQMFVGGFQTALNPQIVKYFAEGNLKQMHELVFSSSRFSFYLLFVLSLPVILEAEALLTLWLVDVPPYTVTFVQIMLCIMLVDSMANPLITAANATGNIEKYQKTIGGLLLLILPLSYVALKLGGAPWAVFVVHLIVAMVAQTVRLFIIRPMINLSIREYLTKVMLDVAMVLLFSLPLPLIVKYFMPKGVWSALVVIAVSVVSTTAVVFLLGLGKEEKKFILSKIRKNWG